MMKRTLLLLLVFALLLHVAPSAFALSTGAGSIAEVPVSILKGQSSGIKTLLPAEAQPLYKNLVWESSDTAILICKDGKLQARLVGQATLTGNDKLSGETIVRLIVTVLQPVTKVSLNLAKTTLVVGKTIALYATILPEALENKAVLWKSSNTKVATVDETGLVTAHAKGKATITCTATDGSGKKATCKVTVTERGTVNKNIERYGIPSALGKARLTIEEIEALIGKTPEEIRDAISTAADLLQYMICASFQPGPGDTRVEENGTTWHYNDSGQDALRKNLGNCGGTANVVNYVLAGDYDEVGFVQFSSVAYNGGHIYNYIKAGGKYYFIDYIQYMHGGSYDRFGYRVLKYDKLTDYVEYCKDGGPDGRMKLVVAYQSAGSHLPIGDKYPEGIMRYFPNDAAITVIWETPDIGATVAFATPPLCVPDWRN